MGWGLRWGWLEEGWGRRRMGMYYCIFCWGMWGVFWGREIMVKVVVVKGKKMGM